MKRIMQYKIEQVEDQGLTLPLGADFHTVINSNGQLYIVATITPGERLHGYRVLIKQGMDAVHDCEYVGTVPVLKDERANKSLLHVFVS